MFFNDGVTGRSVSKGSRAICSFDSAECIEDDDPNNSNREATKGKTPYHPLSQKIFFIDGVAGRSVSKGSRAICSFDSAEYIEDDDPNNFGLL